MQGTALARQELARDTPIVSFQDMNYGIIPSFMEDISKKLFPAKPLDQQGGSSAAYMAGNGLSIGEEVLFLSVDRNDVGFLL